MLNKMKAVLFARVSTREQAEEGYSLAAQAKLLKDYAVRNDFEVIKQFIVPESATGRQERKIFNELLEYLYEHTQVKIQLWEKVDRSARNFKDSVKLDDWLNEDEGRQIHFVKQSLIMHKDSKSHEKFMWDIYVATARQYSNNLSEETKKGLIEKAEEGYYPGNHKRGYKTIGDIGHKTWLIDNESPDLRYIPMAFELYDSGNYTLRTLASELFRQGWSIKGKPISTSELHILLSDPFYCGQEFVWKEKLYTNGKQPQLITKELFYHVQERLQRKLKAGKYTKHEFLYGGGLSVCGNCFRCVTWDLKKGHNYGHCTRHNNNCNQRKYIREEKVEEQIFKIFDSLKVTNLRVLEWVRKALLESHQNEHEYHVSTLKELDDRVLQLEKRLSILYDDRIDGKINKDFYEKKREQYQGELEAALEAKEQHVKANIDYMQLGVNIFELTQRGRQVYEEKMLLGERREFLNFIFSNLKIKDGQVVPTFHNGFQVVASRAEKGNWLRDLDSDQDRRSQSPSSYH